MRSHEAVFLLRSLHMVGVGGVIVLIAPWLAGCHDRAGTAPRSDRSSAVRADDDDQASILATHVGEQDKTMPNVRIIEGPRGTWTIVEPNWTIVIPHETLEQCLRQLEGIVRTDVAEIALSPVGTYRFVGRRAGEKKFDGILNPQQTRDTFTELRTVFASFEQPKEAIDALLRRLPADPAH